MKMIYNWKIKENSYFGEGNFESEEALKIHISKLGGELKSIVSKEEENQAPVQPVQQQIIKTVAEIEAERQKIVDKETAEKEAAAALQYQKDCQAALALLAIGIPILLAMNKPAKQGFIAGVGLPIGKDGLPESALF